MTNHFLFEKNYDETAVVSKNVAEEMLARLEFFTLQPRKIIDLGCKTGFSSVLLKKHFPTADIISIDSMHSMLQYAQKNASVSPYVCAEEIALPFPNHSIDFVFANFLIFSPAHLEKVFAECYRVLREEGLIFFSSLGPDTLRELHSKKLSLPYFIDMHDIGDALVHAHFSDPVLDVEYFTVTYEDDKKLFDELQKSMMIAEECDVSQCVVEEKSLTYEVIYGHAWRVSNHSADEEGVVKIPLAHLRKRA